MLAELSDMISQKTHSTSYAGSTVGYIVENISATLFLLSLMNILAS